MAGPAIPTQPSPSQGDDVGGSDVRDAQRLGGGRSQPADVAPPAAGRSRRGDLWRRLARNELAVAGGLILLLVVIAAVFAPYLSPEDPLEMNPSLLLQPPSGAPPGSLPVTFNAPFFNAGNPYDLLIKGTSNDSVTIDHGRGRECTRRPSQPLTPLRFDRLNHADVL